MAYDDTLAVYGDDHRAPVKFGSGECGMRFRVLVPGSRGTNVDLVDTRNAIVELYNIRALG